MKTQVWLACFVVLCSLLVITSSSDPAQTKPKRKKIKISKKAVKSFFYSCFSAFRYTKVYSATNSHMIYNEINSEAYRNANQGRDEAWQYEEELIHNTPFTLKEDQVDKTFHYYIKCFVKIDVALQYTGAARPKVYLGVLLWRDLPILELNMENCDKSVWENVVVRRQRKNKHRILVYRKDRCVQYWMTLDGSSHGVTNCPWSFSTNALQDEEVEYDEGDERPPDENLPQVDENVSESGVVNTYTKYDVSSGQTMVAASSGITTSIVKQFRHLVSSSGGNRESHVIAVHHSDFELLDRCQRNSKIFKLHAEWRTKPDDDKYKMFVNNGGLIHAEYTLYCYRKTDEYVHKEGRIQSALFRLGIYGIFDDLLLELESSTTNCNTGNIVDFIEIGRPRGLSHVIKVVSTERCTEYEISDIAVNEKACSSTDIQTDIWEKAWPPVDANNPDAYILYIRD